jgi:hypothetical protein
MDKNPFWAKGRKRNEEINNKLMNTIKMFFAAMLMTLGFTGLAQAATVNLYEKNPTDWTVVTDGGVGELTYQESGVKFDFKVTGTGLVEDASYSLVYYPDPWPGTGLVCIGTATTTSEGAINFEGSTDIGYNLPIDSDLNAATTTTTLADGTTGAKVWLVTTSDVDCGGQKMTGWNPSDYLFEDKLITYTKTEPVVVTPTVVSNPAPARSQIGGERRMWERDPQAWIQQQIVFIQAKIERLQAELNKLLGK